MLLETTEMIFPTLMLCFCNVIKFILTIEMKDTAYYFKYCYSRKKLQLDIHIKKSQIVALTYIYYIWKTGN